MGGGFFALLPPPLQLWADGKFNLQHEPGGPRRHRTPRLLAVFSKSHRTTLLHTTKVSRPVTCSHRPIAQHPRTGRPLPAPSTRMEEPEGQKRHEKEAQKVHRTKAKEEKRPKLCDMQLPPRQPDDASSPVKISCRLEHKGFSFFLLSCRERMERMEMRHHPQRWGPASGQYKGHPRLRRSQKVLGVEHLRVWPPPESRLSNLSQSLLSLKWAAHHIAGPGRQKKWAQQRNLSASPWPSEARELRSN